MADDRVRIKIQWQSQVWYFVRMEDDRRPLIAPYEEIHKALLMSREAAVARCRLLRAGGWAASVVTPSGVTLFEDATAPPVPIKAPERQNMTIAGLLFVVGNPPRNGYCLRFPGTAIESLWAPTPEEVYQRLLDHPLAADLTKAAEKYNPPPEPPVDIEALKRQIQFARHGRIRPADLG
jgi:hypothetical protein